ncbi:MAG: type VI secretion system baseplate subunit TssE [Alphaproteobacteria bacterium]|nr:type VI secretion system baseplate subunit TssE [Alphaproteobacteria bacterium]
MARIGAAGRAFQGGWSRLLCPGSELERAYCVVDPLGRFLPTSEKLAHSLLDRLIDHDPDLKVDPPRPIGEQVQALREGLRRDLEALLNTRRCPTTPSADPRSDLSSSLLTYGVDGFFAANLVTQQQRDELARALESSIQQCEPRLENVRVSALPPRSPGERSLRLRIEAVHRLQPDLPGIAFETAVDPTTQRLSIEAAHG